MDIAVFLVAGLVALVFGGDWLVDGAVNLAKRARISSLLIGITLVGFGTSTPELVTSLQAAFIGAPGIAFGNVIGSNIANILLILGLAAIISPILVARSTLSRDGLVMIVATAMCVAIVLTGLLERLFGVVLVCMLFGYVLFAYFQERRQAITAASLPATTTIEDEPEEAVGPLWLDIARVVLGLALTVIGARWLVSSAVDLARIFDVSEAVIGLTIVAVGTSLPELVTTIAAARRGQADLALGNVIGSNIFNILFILGVTALVKPIAVPPDLSSVDVWLMMIISVGLVAGAWFLGRIPRLVGGLMLMAYVVYSLWLYLAASGT